MYFWKTSILASELAENKVSQVEQLKYFLAMSILYAVGTTPVGEASENVLIELLIVLTLTMLGIFYCFRINKRGDNDQFIVRMVCLSWPITIKIIIFSIILVIVSSFTLLFISEELADAIFENDNFWSLLLALIICIYYWRLGIHIDSVCMYSVKPNPSLRNGTPPVGGAP